MPVFISHKREDGPKALEIVNHLMAQNVVCYVDLLDPTLKTTTDITSTLMARIELCTHLMAVLSDYTVLSWWVPFEVGVATEKQRRITSFQVKAQKLPDFLYKWPVLSSHAHLDEFVRQYRQDTLVPMNESRSATASTKTADQFHSRLKAALGQ